MSRVEVQIRSFSNDNDKFNGNEVKHLHTYRLIDFPQGGFSKTLLTQMYSYLQLKDKILKIVQILVYKY